ncbi:MAG: glutathione S-transferase family protein [Alphaproteobacteria bacterium]|nr:glutathione S-transferase family protein [Alphaproteobacteria bacterium]
MADLVIHGFAASSYVRTARMAAIEKGVAHTLAPIEFRAPSHAALHPFMRMPAMHHGDFHLWESVPIARYIDRAFPGPALAPADIRGVAVMEQWISAVHDYVARTILGEIVVERLVVPMFGGKPDEAKVAAAMPKAAQYLGILDRRLAEAPYLAGGAISVADLCLYPMAFLFRLQPEAGAMLAQTPALARWMSGIDARPAARETLPEMPKPG